MMVIAEPSELFFQHWDLLGRLARKRFPDVSLADEALNFVQDRLQAGDWSRIRAFRGKSSFATYIGHVANRLLEDFSRSKFGRSRPPGWVVALGAFWEQVYRLLCEERLSVTDVVESLKLSAPGGRDPSAIEETVTTVLARIPDCGKRIGETIQEDPEDLDGHTLESSSLHQRSPEDLLALKEKEAVLAVLSCCLGDVDVDVESSDDPRLNGIIESLKSGIQLSVQERLLLKMVFCDHMTVSDAGRQLGLRVHQATGRMRRLLDRLRQVFHGTGVVVDLKAASNED